MATPKKNNSNKKHAASQFFNCAPGSYLERTSRPLYAIVFLLPFIVFYEIGTLLINMDVLSQSQIRVVAFVWLQQTLEYFGSSTRFAWAVPPLVVLAILLGYQLAARKPWSFRNWWLWRKEGLYRPQARWHPPRVDYWVRFESLERDLLNLPFVRAAASPLQPIPHLRNRKRNGYYVWLYEDSAFSREALLALQV